MKHPVRYHRRIVLLPTSAWFDQVRQYDAGLSDLGMDLKRCMVATLKTITTNAINNPSGRLFMTPSSYNARLTCHLMSVDSEYDVKRDLESILQLVEVSTHFYYELTEYFKVMRLDHYQIVNMVFKAWMFEDMAVSIPYCE